MSGKHGDGCHGGGCLPQMEIFLRLSCHREACHCLVHVLGLVEDKGQNQVNWSPRKLLANVGNPNRSALIDLY